MATEKLLGDHHINSSEQKVSSANAGINAGTHTVTVLSPPAKAPPLSAQNNKKEKNGGIRLSFDDIRLDIAISKKENISILKGITGCAYPGELYGILGASGGGKTTLLSILTGRLRSIASLRSNSKCSGVVTMNNITVDCSNDREFNYLSKNIAFVMQQDLLYATEKCKEAIEASALLRLTNDPSMTREEKIELSHSIMAELDLTKCADTYIGSEEIRGLSGGERTRTSIGIELVTKPDIVILDEPTSGLDSASALTTMTLLKELANRGKTVMACIHQPSSQIFSSIDRVLILAKGLVVYQGKIEPDLYSYLSSINHECPKYCNVADFIIQEINQNTQFFIDKWIEFEENSKISNNNKIMEQPIMNRQMSSASEMNEIEPRKKLGICSQIRILLPRQFRIFIRDKSATLIRIGQTAFIASLVGLIWFRLTPIGNETVHCNESTGNCDLSKVQTNVQNRFGALFLSVTFSVMGAITTSNLIFPAQKLVFEKERRGNWYYTIPWICSKLCVDIPFSFIVAAFWCSITYYLVHFHIPFVWYYLTLVLLNLCGESMGFLVGSFAPNSKVAGQLTPVLVLPLMLFSGFFIAIDTIPVYLRWIRWIDMFFYGIELLCVNEFHNVQAKGTVNGEHVHFDVGNQLLDSYSMHSDDKWRDVYVLLAIFAGLRVLSFIKLIYSNGI